MAAVESIEGTAGSVWFHYDVSGDVLYFRLASATDVEARGEEDDSGFIVRRSLADNRVIGVTIVNWWKRFGDGALPDSFRVIAARVEPIAKQTLSAA